MRVYYNPIERQAMILMAFADRIKTGRNRWLTPYDIARDIGMSNCPSLRELLRTMEDEGRLVSREVNNPGRWPGKEYMLAEGTYQEPKKRSITINCGKNKVTFEVI